jgi:uncharacterized peroxidase-related enzyme
VRSSGADLFVPFIEPIGEDDASGAIAELYEADRSEEGYVANLTQAFSHRPELMLAWRQLLGTIKAPMDERRYELVTVAAARELRSSYCMLAHSGVLAQKFYDEDATRRIAADHRSAGLDQIDVAVMDLAEKVAADATSVTAEDTERLRALGLSDAEIFDVVAAAAARSFFTKIVDGLGFQPDAIYAELDDELREVLVVGRPIDR